MLAHLQTLDAQLAAIDQRLERVASCEPWAEPVKWLCSFRGIATRTALGLLAEIGDFRRFSSPRELMSYLGLTPTEYSSGAQQHRGHITKTGNTHARRLLIEAAWHYQQRPRQSARAAQLRRAGPSRDHRQGMAGPDPAVATPPNARPERETLDRRDDRGRTRARRLRLGRDRPSPIPRTTRRRRCLKPETSTPAGVGQPARPTGGSSNWSMRSRLASLVRGSSRPDTAMRSRPAHPDENVKGWVQEFLLARVTPNEKSRRLGTVEPAAYRLPL